MYGHKLKSLRKFMHDFREAFFRSAGLIFFKPFSAFRSISKQKTQSWRIKGIKSAKIATVSSLYMICCILFSIQLYSAWKPNFLVPDLASIQHSSGRNTLSIVFCRHIFGSFINSLGSLSSERAEIKLRNCSKFIDFIRLAFTWSVVDIMMQRLGSEMVKPESFTIRMKVL